MNGYLKRKANRTLLYILPQLNFYSRNISKDTEHIYLLYKVIDEDTKEFVQWLSNKEYCIASIDVDSIYKLLKIKLPIIITSSFYNLFLFSDLNARTYSKGRSSPSNGGFLYPSRRRIL